MYSHLLLITVFTSFLFHGQLSAQGVEGFVETPENVTVCQPTVLRWSDNFNLPIVDLTVGNGYQVLLDVGNINDFSYTWTPTPGIYEFRTFFVKLTDAHENIASSGQFTIAPNPQFPVPAGDCSNPIFPSSSSSMSSTSSESPTPSSSTMSSSSSETPTSTSSSSSESPSSSSSSSSSESPSSSSSSSSSSESPSSSSSSSSSSSTPISTPSSTITSSSPFTSSSSTLRSSSAPLSSSSPPEPPASSSLPVSSRQPASSAAPASSQSPVPPASSVPPAPPASPIPPAPPASSIPPSPPAFSNIPQPQNPPVPQPIAQPPASPFIPAQPLPQVVPQPAVVTIPAPIPAGVSSAAALPSSFVTITLPASSTATSSLPAYTQSFPSGDMSGFINVTVLVDDPRIVTYGPGWDAPNVFARIPATCNASAMSLRDNLATDSFTFSFVGIAVYMATAETDRSGSYTVSVDGQAPVAVDGFNPSSTPDCGFAWSAWNLDNVAHSVTVNLTGQSSKAAANGMSASSFELDGFTITQRAPDNPTAASSSAVAITPLFSWVLCLLTFSGLHFLI